MDQNNQSEQRLFWNRSVYEKPCVEIIEIEMEKMIANSTNSTGIDDINFEDDEDSWWSKASTTNENINHTIKA